MTGFFNVSAWSTSSFRCISRESQGKRDQAYYLSITKRCAVYAIYSSLQDGKVDQKSKIPYTFVRAGYFMQNLSDFLCKEIKERHRIFVSAGNGKTSFVDTRDLAEVSALSLTEIAKHRNQIYVITGNEALDFYEVAALMTEVLGVKIEYTNPSIKEFKQYMTQSGVDAQFVNVVAGIHMPTKLGLAKGIKHDYMKVTGKNPTTIRQYIEDFKQDWL